MAAGLELLENRPLTDSPEKNTFTQRPLRLERVKLSQDEWAVKSYVGGRIFLIAFFLRSTYKTLETRGVWLRHKSWVGSGNEST